MTNKNQVKNRFLNIKSEEEFNATALETFHYQYNNIEVYSEFCNSLNRTNPSHYSEIPFLPISFFKTHKIFSKELKSTPEVVFKSSGTTQGGLRSQHYIAFPDIYEASFLPTFASQMVDPKEAIVFALLPNYLEQGDSSLVYMVDYLIKESRDPLSGFYLNDIPKLLDSIQKAKATSKEIILLGVSYALLDLADEKEDLSGVKIIETGGMKGRRKEMIKEELHEYLKEGLNLNAIYSEYGMTELLSQGYTDGTEFFSTPNWMKILIRDINDPLQILGENRTGGVNVIDLANYYSCSFIATDDLGQVHSNQFKILGRFDNSDIRGCNLLIG